MALRVYKYGEKVLREKATPVTEVTSELRQLAVEMLMTMAAAKGVGLAAQQVGRTERLCVIDIPEGNFDSNVYAINFVYFKGIENPWFSSVAAKTVNSATDRVKDLGAYTEA